MQEVILLQHLTKDIIRGLGELDKQVVLFKTTVHEDNTGALKLATMEPGRMTPRSKFYDVKVHWFRSMLNEHIRVGRVCTKLQVADIYTKPLPREDFERLRKLLCGW